MCAFFFAATLSCCSDRRKSVGPSAPIAYATSVSPPDEAVAWPGAGLWCWVWLPLFQVQVFGAGYGCRLAGVEVTGGKLCCWLSVSQFLQITAHSNTHCYLRRPDHSPVPGAVPKQKRTTNTCWSSSFVLLLSWRFYSAGCHLQRTGETIAPSSCSATSLPCALI